MAGTRYVSFCNTEKPLKAIAAPFERPYKVEKLHALLLEGWNVRTARIASHKPLIWEICDRTEEVHVIQEEFPSYLKEARDGQVRGIARRVNYEEEMM